MRACFVVWEGCAWQEVAAAAAMCGEVREVCVAASTRAPVRVQEGYTLLPDTTLAGLGELAELVVPGGSLDAAWNDPGLCAELARLAGSATRVGAICNGVALLGRAGVLGGRRVTHTCTPRYAAGPEWAPLLEATGPALAGTTYVDEDVVVDGALITAKPWAALRFARELADSALPDGAAAARWRYLRGERDLPGVDPHERWVVELTPVEGVPTPRAVVFAHVAWLAGLEARGLLWAGGPFPEAAAGMIVLRVPSREEAENILQGDPFVQEGVRRPTLRRWTLSCADNHHLGVLRPAEPAAKP